MRQLQRQALENEIGYLNKVIAELKAKLVVAEKALREVYRDVRDEWGGTPESYDVCGKIETYIKQLQSGEFGEGERDAGSLGEC